MEQFKCEKCGSSDFTVQNGMYICQYCGASYPIPATDKAGSDSSNNPNTINIHVDTTVTSTESNISEKSWLATLLLEIFLGYLGIHRFYVGKIGTGILWLLTLGFMGIGWIVDLIMIIIGRFKDKHGKYVRRH